VATAVELPRQSLFSADRISLKTESTLQGLWRSDRLTRLCSGKVTLSAHSSFLPSRQVHAHDHARCPQWSVLTLRFMRVNTPDFHQTRGTVGGQFI
jgi:hypothetical protein